MRPRVPPKNVSHLTGETLLTKDGARLFEGTEMPDFRYSLSTNISTSSSLGAVAIRVYYVSAYENDCKIATWGSTAVATSGARPITS